MSAAGKHGTLWSPAEVEQLESMLSKQVDLTEIAAQLGRTQKAVETKISTIQRQRYGPKGGRQQRRYNGASFFLS